MRGGESTVALSCCDVCKGKSDGDSRIEMIIATITKGGIPSAAPSFEASLEGVLAARGAIVDSSKVDPKGLRGQYGTDGAG